MPQQRMHMHAVVDDAPITAIKGNKSLPLLHSDRCCIW